VALEHTNLILATSGQTCGPLRLQDIRTTLSAMRKLAWREGWLDRSVDPLDGSEVKSGRQQLRGAGGHYVAPEQRPALHMALAMAAAADHLCVAGTDAEEPLRRLPLFGTKIRVATYGGPRLGEQNALRAIDVYFESNRIFINGSWTHPRQKDRASFRGPVKNKVLHWAPLPASVMAELLPRCAVLLGLPETASKQQVINAQRRERSRREQAARRLSDPEIGWYNLPVDPSEELWLFVDTTTGLPVTGHEHTSSWHKVRRWVDQHDPEHSWPDFIVYRNLRHHAATWWHEELGRDWVDVAAWLGDKVTTVLEHYVLSGQGALDEASEQMERY
jgi:integrase